MSENYHTTKDLITNKILHKLHYMHSSENPEELYFDENLDQEYIRSKVSELSDLNGHPVIEFLDPQSVKIYKVSDYFTMQILNKDDVKIRVHKSNKSYELSMSTPKASISLDNVTKQDIQEMILHLKDIEDKMIRYESFNKE